MLVVRCFKPISVFRGTQEVGMIDFSGKSDKCKNGMPVLGRWSQQAGGSVYVVDHRGGGLYRVEWQDVKYGKYCKTPVKSRVNDFYVDRDIGLCTVSWNGVLTLNSGTEVLLNQKVELDTNWTIVTCIVKCWIVSGQSDGHAIIASISNKGCFVSTAKLKLSSNGYKS